MFNSNKSIKKYLEDYYDDFQIIYQDVKPNDLMSQTVCTRDIHIRFKAFMSCGTIITVQKISQRV